jgi:hypothetical protein
MNRATLTWVPIVAAISLLAGCSTLPGGSTSPDAGGTMEPIATSRPNIPEDSDAFLLLDEVAPASLKLEGGVVISTACWTPSEHLFNESSVATLGTWKVLCRVYYTLAGARRYQDSTCIGDFEATPMLDHCYVWEYYTYEARFSDGDRLASPAPTPRG